MTILWTPQGYVRLNPPPARIGFGAKPAAPKPSAARKPFGFDTTRVVPK